ncbi:MAG: hypothetical protein IJC19_04820, partial [Clostridia bacterium]|nr:hypothetical protein [Clostridia bacterium]
MRGIKTAATACGVIIFFGSFPKAVPHRNNLRWGQSVEKVQIVFLFQIFYLQTIVTFDLKQSFHRFAVPLPLHKGGMRSAHFIGFASSKIAAFLALFRTERPSASPSPFPHRE